MTSDYSSLIQYLSGSGSVAEEAGLDSDQILRALRKKAAKSTDPMDIFKAELLTKAELLRQIGGA